MGDMRRPPFWVFRMQKDGLQVPKRRSHHPCCVANPKSNGNALGIVAS